MTTGSWNFDGTSQQYCNWLGGSYSIGPLASRSWSGTNTPDPKARDVNYYNGSRSSLMYGIIGFKNIASPTTEWFAPAHVFSQNVSTINPEADLWPTPVQLWGKMREEVARHSFNAAVAGGEANKALKMLADTARRVTRGFSHLKRGNVVAALKSWGYRQSASSRVVDEKRHHVIGVLTGDKQGSKKRVTLRNVRTGHTYVVVKQRNQLDPGALLLEVKYGWIPLYTDIFNAATAVYAATNNPERETFQVKVTWKGPYYSAPADIWAENRYQHTAKLTLELFEDYPVWRSLGLDNPLSVAWELLPYSFVFDWIAPVGAYLEARAFVNGIKGRYWRSWFGRIQLRSIPDKCVPAGYKMTTLGWFERRFVSYERTAWTNVSNALKAEGFTPVQFRKWNSNQNMVRAAVSCALLQQQGRKFAYGRVG